MDKPQRFGRKDERAEFSGPATLTVLTNAGPTPVKRPMQCTIIDVSSSGLSVSLSVLLAEGATVQLELKAEGEAITVTGTVMNCKRIMLTSYRVGLQLKFSDD